ncbi:response regulator transcription factor [Gracilibacillus salinarum]|uniref:Response regulator n=1 Tax=Gracilibacillus salinarum TaxID=2932255 RepID=A0ABY4GT69_9BACI|nr:response regulator [Gracilibacillus salinarum]UOQ86867.1 response regulator [Gracilibacillus salinarum]
MYKMMIIDDESEIRIGLKNYFPWNQIGFDVVKDCVDGKVALNYLDQHDIDVILSDIRMPVLDGIELAKKLHESGSNIYLIFLSGYKDFSYAKEALKYGVKDYIVKPGKFEEIQEVFSRVKLELDKEWRELDENQASYCENIIRTMKEHIQKQYASICLEDMAEVLNMSPNYISSYFKEKTGENFSTYLTKIKMEKAAELLVDYHYKTYEISELVGYHNPKNFTRMFKKYYGMTPRDYRTSNMENMES